MKSKAKRLPVLSTRTTQRSPTEFSGKSPGFEVSEFSTQRELVQATEREILKLQQARGHELLDGEFKLAVSLAKKKSEKSNFGARDFRVKKTPHEGSSLVLGSNALSHIMLKVRKKSSPMMLPFKREEKEVQPIEKKVITFFNTVKDPEILRAADETLEQGVKNAIDRKDMVVFQSNIGELVAIVQKVLDSIETSHLELEREHFEIMVDICRRKIDFIEKSYNKVLSFSSTLNASILPPIVEGDQSLENTAFGSSLTFDVKYFMSALKSQEEYFHSKMEIFRWNDDKNIDKVAELYNKYLDHKTILQVKSQKKDFVSFIESGQAMMEDWIKLLTNANSINKRQEFEITALKTQIEDLKKSIDRERASVHEVQLQLRSTLAPDMVLVRRKFEENFAEVMSSLKAEVQKANEDKNNYMTENIRLQDIVHKFEMDKLKRESNKQTKETQSVFQIGAAKELKKLFTDVLNSPEKIAISKGDSSSKGWLCGVINYLIVARFNYESEKESISNDPKSMKNFIIESLLVKFGSAQAAEHILRDFIASIKKYSAEGERFKLFARFLGIEDILSNDIVKKRKGNKYEDFLTNYYYTSHLAIRDYLEFVLLAKGFEYYEDSSLKPLLGFCVNKRTQQLMIPIDVAKKIFLLYILAREPKNFLQPELLQDEFDNILKEDLYDRLHDRGKEIKIKNFKSEEFLISYDYLAKVLIERRLNYFIDEVQKFLSALTVSSASRGEKNVFYDDLNFSCRAILPNITENQIGQIFREIADSPQLQSYSIERMIQSAVHTIVLLSKSYQTLDLNRLVLTKESYNERVQMISAAENAMNARLRANTVKKEGSKFQALLDGLHQWREKHLLGSTAALVDGVEWAKLQLRWRLDNVTNLVFLQESYDKTKERIVLAEKSSEQIGPSHIQIRDFLNGVPEKLVFRHSYEELKEHEQAGLAEQIENMWKQLRRIISLTFFHNQMD
jgi:hypothetical protein